MVDHVIFIMELLHQSGILLCELPVLSYKVFYIVLEQFV